MRLHKMISQLQPRVKCIWYFTFLLMGIGSVGHSIYAEELGRTPGFMWSQARDQSDLIDERGNGIIEGVIEQGIDSNVLLKHFRLNAFVRFHGNWDEEALDWNRKYLYAIGGKLRYTGIPKTLISIGASYDTEIRSVSDERQSGITTFLSWGAYWNLSKFTGNSSNTIGLIGIPGTTWGELRYPASHFGEESTVTKLEGAMEQGIDWLGINENVILNTFARIEYTLDSKQLDWNNKIELGPGAKIKIYVGTKGLLELGLQYKWSHRFESDRTSSGNVIFIDWNLAWDFGGFKQKSY